jgi:hypothetical protein
MDAKDYDPLHLEVLYIAFRHKLAHLSIPYVVFDTALKMANRKRRRITWTVHASKRSAPIELVDYDPPRFIEKALRPWDVSYDCRVHISVRSFQIDITNSIYGPAGYLRHLQSDLAAQENFAKCMKVLFPA